MKNILRFGLCILLLSGCAKYTPTKTVVAGFTKFETGGGTKLANYSEAAAHNADKLNAYKALGEWRHNGNPNDPPKLGLALSGGGMRSGSVAIGVLKGLYKKKLLDKVDVVSSVSGGGYAASWFYSQQFYADLKGNPVDLKNLFVDDATHHYQQFLQDHGELIAHTGNSTLRRIEYAKGLANIVFIPFNLVFNGVFGWHVNTAPGRVMYEHGINRTFNTVPKANYDGPSLFNDYFNVLEYNITFPGLADYFRKKEAAKQKLAPLWVINTTSNIDDNEGHYGANLANTVFEFTPYQFGSDYYGYWQYPEEFPISMHTAVAVSGAAVDSYRITGSATRTLLSAFNFDLGYYFNNPNPDITTTKRVVHAVLPFPFYLMHRYNKDGNGTRIYLTDGGHSENLGAYSLVKRACSTIIIIDAEHDPKYKFNAYTVLKDGIRADMGAELAVEGVEKAIRTQSFDHSHPVMKGKISFFPVKTDDGTVRDIEIDVYYVKLSIDRAKICDGSEGCDAAWYGRSVNDYVTRVKKSDGFPQQSTADLTYDRQQFEAYRDLGEALITNYLDDAAVVNSISR